MDFRTKTHFFVQKLTWTYVPTQGTIYPYAQAWALPPVPGPKCVAVYGACTYVQVNIAILRPLANPETLKNSPMCMFEELAHGDGHFSNIFENIPQLPSPPNPTPGVGGALGVFHGCFSSEFKIGCLF